MRKQDFCTSVIFNVTSIILFIEHLCGLELALNLLIIWTILSLIVHIYIIRDYIRITIEEE